MMLLFVRSLPLTIGIAVIAAELFQPLAHVYMILLNIGVPDGVPSEVG